MTEMATGKRERGRVLKINMFISNSKSK